jgi:pimeloyl-ACP methyl ester carboxylesterase
LDGQRHIKSQRRKKKSLLTIALDILRWRHVLPSLRPRISLFVPEIPGYGFSSPPAAYDKRTVGALILSALRTTFGSSRPIIWCGHDRGARIGHRLLVDHSNPSSSSSPKDQDNTNHNEILSAIIIDIVPTLRQWQSFSHPAASRAYFHWPFLALPHAADMILAMGGANFTRMNLRNALGENPAGRAGFEADGAVEVYCRQFDDPECVRGACADYAAAAGEDVDLQMRDMEQPGGGGGGGGGRNVIRVPTMVIYSARNLGRMHDVPGAWEGWIDAGVEARFVGVGDGHGHYLPEEASELVAERILEWIDRTAEGKGRGK